MLRAKNQVWLLLDLALGIIHFPLKLKDATADRWFLQALLQMQDIPSAINAMQVYTNVQPTIRYGNSCIDDPFFSLHMNFSFCLLLLIIEENLLFPSFTIYEFFLAVSAMFFNSGVGMYMFNFHLIKNWLQWSRTLKAEEMRSVAFFFFPFRVYCVLWLFNWFELASLLVTSYLCFDTCED